MKFKTLRSSFTHTTGFVLLFHATADKSISNYIQWTKQHWY